MLKSKNLIEKSIKIIKKQLGLELWPKKNIFIHFNKKKIEPGSTELHIDDNIMNSSETAKILGVIFDYTFSFKDEIKPLIKRYSRA